MLILSVVWVFIFGLIIGSFLNALIWRIHTGEGMGGRSHCPKCQHQIAWYDNVPLLSFIILGGKCRHCRKNISLQYPLVELSTGILFAITFWHDYQALTSEISTLQLLRDFYLISVLTVIFIYDLRWYLILDKVTIPSVIVLAGLNLILGLSWQNVLFSGIIGGSFFLVQYVVSKGKWIGGGDIRMGVLMGVALGWPKILIAIFIAYILGSIIGIGLILSKNKHWSSKVPFGTFLAVAAVIAQLWGMGLAEWYMNLFNFR